MIRAGYWGDSRDLGEANFNGKGTSEVGAFPADPWGLHDMLGNVLEWVADYWHDGYQGAPKDGGAWTIGRESGRVLRGGSWKGNRTDYRAGSRGWLHGAPRTWIGFRLARTL
jgi:formylglycine-generating enzyme required for sulfatase activity